jgi:hypothetical protein
MKTLKAFLIICGLSVYPLTFIVLVLQYLGGAK